MKNKLKINLNTLIKLKNSYKILEIIYFYIKKQLIIFNLI